MDMSALYKNKMGHFISSLQPLFDTQDIEFLGMAIFQFPWYWRAGLEDNTGCSPASSWAHQSTAVALLDMQALHYAQVVACWPREGWSYCFAKWPDEVCHTWEISCKLEIFLEHSGGNFIRGRTRESAQWLRACAVPAEDPSSTPSTHVLIGQGFLQLSVTVDRSSSDLLR